jgi:hypothetical protein
MGLAADKTFGYVYSIGEDAKFKLTEINAHSVVSDLQPGKAPLKHMIYNKSRAIFIMGDADGNVFVYSQNHVRIISSFITCLASPRAINNSSKSKQRMYQRNVHLIRRNFLGWRSKRWIAYDI